MNPSRILGSVLGLSIALASGLGGVAAQPESLLCLNTQSGESIELPVQAVDRVAANNPNVTCRTLVVPPGPID